LTIRLLGTPSPERCTRYSRDENPLSNAICSARTSVTIAVCGTVSSVRSTAVSQQAFTSSMVDGTAAVPEVTNDLPFWDI
jgi:hypothetical protein